MRKAMALDTKYDSEVCKQMNLTKSTVSTIWKDKDKILEYYLTNYSAKNLRKSANDELDRGRLK